MLTGSGRGCSGHDVNGGSGGNDGNGGSGGSVAKCLQPGVWAPVWPWAAANMGLSCLLSGHRHPQLSGSRTRGQPDYNSRLHWYKLSFCLYNSYLELRDQN